MKATNIGSISNLLKSLSLVLETENSLTVADFRVAEKGLERISRTGMFTRNAPSLYYLRRMSVSDSIENAMSFEAIYCRARGIDASKFERSLILDGVSLVFRPIVGLLLMVFPRLFRTESHHLSSFRTVSDRRQFVAEMGSITDFNLYQLPFWRSILGLRVSTRRLSKLRKLLPKS